MRVGSKFGLSKGVAVGSKSKPRAKQRASGDFVDRVDGVVHGTVATESVHVTDQAVPLSALLAVQQVQSTTVVVDQQRLWAQHWGSDVLSRLSQLREGLLMGRIPAERLQKLIETLDTREQDIDDPDLRQIIDEIELRGRIEIAKLQVAQARDNTR